MRHPATGWRSGPAENPRRAEEIAALLSHELRTPLTVLHAALQLLDRDLPQDPALPARRHIDQALAEARQLDQLTSQLWDAACLQMGTLRLHRERVPLTPLVREVCRRVQPLLPNHWIAFSAPSTGLVVKADWRRLDQMLVNLLLDAVIYAPGSPRIDVHLRRARADVLVEVQEYGGTVANTELPRLTWPFYHPPSDQRPSRRGLGLGLYLCRELARLQGGGLDIARGSHDGARLTLRLPLAAA